MPVMFIAPLLTGVPSSVVPGKGFTVKLPVPSVKVRALPVANAASAARFTPVAFFTLTRR